MHEFIQAAECFAVISMALMGGVYFVFSAFVMKALQHAGNGSEAMVEINRFILKSLFMPVFSASTLLALMLLLWQLMNEQNIFIISGSAVYIGGMFICTALFNVPLNNRLLAAQHSNGENPFWPVYLRQWTRWNHLRMLSSLLAAALIGAA
ncbi:MAG: hypothetical protein CMI02_13535 [Oceanospirillaceae bacterium]|nr:hypothetical protein [Oceanospirillaceae bacterium]MBT13044.1 hypothetical protein [Oceanospirillaceae bacterium]|tara:strand:- start:38662 stop:39114 length:453 start_codon:yes stop_codon:yes gene_type:complete